MKIKTLIISAMVFIAGISCGQENPQKQDVSQREHLQNISRLRLDLAKEKVFVATNMADKCQIIVSSLQEEVSSPVTFKIPNNYMTVSQLAERGYLDMLLALGEDSVDYLDEILPTTADRVKKIIQFAMAKNGDKELYPDLVETVDSEEEPFLRYLAVRALGYIQKRDVVPVLKKALKDPYFIDASDCGGKYRVFPVREEAAQALKRRGMDVKQKGENIEISE